MFFRPSGLAFYQMGTVSQYTPYHSILLIYGQYTISVLWGSMLDCTCEVGNR